MRRIAAIGIILVAAAMFIFGLVSLLNEETKAESTFYGATMVRADNRNMPPQFAEAEFDVRGVNDTEIRYKPYKKKEHS